MEKSLLVDQFAELCNVLQWGGKSIENDEFGKAGGEGMWVTQ